MTHEPASLPVRPSYRTALAEATARLAAAGIADARREARLLLAHVLGPGAAALPDPETPVDAAALGAALARRAAREPLAYITGRAGFWSLDLAVGPATLIPRADSETVVDAVLAACPARESVRRLLDLGTGSGCLLLALLHEYPGAWGVGIDRNPAAAALAAGNARTAGLADRAAFLAGDWVSALGRPRFDVVVSNPPYIPDGDMPGLMPEVVAYEPALALAGGADGLTAYRALIPACRDLLRPGGVASFEFGIGQAEAVVQIARDAGFADAAIRADLAGLPRALVLRASV